MNTINLNFNGPYQFSTLQKHLNPKTAGIYIWGFKELLPNRPEVAIPYYVGIKVDCILSRIIKHRMDILSLNSTYKRLSEGYMHEYFLGKPHNYPPFPLSTSYNKKKKLSWGNGWNYPYDYDRSFDYINNLDFLQNIKHVKSPNLINTLSEFPIYFLKQNSFVDTLADRIKADNFWIYFTEVDKENEAYKKLYTSVGKKHRKAFEYIEAFVKYSLKGITVSDSKPFNSCKNLNISISGCPEIFKDSPSETFRGDY